MRKIIIGAQVSMDGVMQAPGGPTEDPTKGFRFGGWAMPYFNQEFGEEIDRVFKNFDRSEEHTSELQSRLHLVCRLLLEKKKSANHAAPDYKRVPHEHGADAFGQPGQD